MRLETARLILREPLARDARAFYGIWGDRETTRFLGGTKTRAEVDAVVARMQAHWDSYGVGLFTVERKADGGVLGRVGLLLWDPVRWVSAFHEPLREPVETEVGWTLAREHWGRGYATEAALACRDWALGPLGLARLISLIAHGNVASIRVAEKIGESFERDVEGGSFEQEVGIWSLGAGPKRPVAQVRARRRPTRHNCLEIDDRRSTSEVSDEGLRA
jgi:RimJ/RimL family protein N-acetyltransferase